MANMIDCRHVGSKMGILRMGLTRCATRGRKAAYRGKGGRKTEEEGMLARDALMNNPQRLLETGKPVASKDARRVWEGAVGKGLALVSTSLAAYFI